jgi:hypothetical protein
MSYLVRPIDRDQSLAQLETIVRQSETADARLVTLAAGTSGGQDVNLLTLRQGTAGGEISLESIDGATAVQQQAEIRAKATGGRDLVCYARVWVQGNRRMVAAYRG